MSMSKIEKASKKVILKRLRDEWYGTYANIFELFDLHITDDPETIGFMEPAKGCITINRNIDADQFSVVIRHEILHFYLEHEMRLLRHIAESQGLPFDELSDMSIREIKNLAYSNKVFNIAADYEISNLGYTEEDKKSIRSILLNGQVLTGLVTEDQHPDWVNLSLEEMYDKLIEMMPEEQPPEEGEGGGEEPPEEPPEDPPEGGGEKPPQDPPKGPKPPQKPQGPELFDPDDFDEDDQDDDEEEEDDEEDEEEDDEEPRGIVIGKFVDNNTFLDKDGRTIRFPITRR